MQLLHEQMNKEMPYILERELGLESENLGSKDLVVSPSLPTC